MNRARDVEVMEHADGELDERAAAALEERLAHDADARAKLDGIAELGELVRGHLELASDEVPDTRFAAMWREIDKQLDLAQEAAAPEAAPKAESVPAGAGLWTRIARWFDHYRGHIITGAVSAGAVAALALVLRGPDAGDSGKPGNGGASQAPINATAASYRPTEIESLDTPGGTGTVFNLEDEDGSTTVIWVTPEDTVEGI